MHGNTVEAASGHKTPASGAPINPYSQSSAPGNKGCTPTTGT
jgi:hypothetical protein